jgi:hypothetical protein
MNQKGGRVSKKLGHFSKTDVGFWRGSSNPAGQRHRNWLEESNKKNLEFMSEHARSLVEYLKAPQKINPP